jgi:hypothetical protein
MEELFTYYSLDEAIDRDLVVNKLKSLKRESKIELSFEGDTFKIKDIDLEESEIEYLLELFDDNDIFPDYDRENDDDDNDDYLDYYDDDDNY